MFRLIRNSLYSGTDKSFEQGVSEYMVFRMNRNPTLAGTRPLDPLAIVLGLIQERLPSGWTADVEYEPTTPFSTGRMWRPDAVIELRAPDGARGRLLVELKTRANPRDVEQLARLVSDPLLLVTSYLPARTRDFLAEQAVNYADATGNIRLVLDRPAVYLETRGAAADPWRTADQPLKSLRGAGAGSAVRALLDFRPPYGVRELAAKSGSSPASISRVADLLFKERLLERDQEGRITDLDWEGVIRRWAEDYAFFRTNRSILRVLAPRGPLSIVDSIYASQDRYALSGAAAAGLIAPVPSESVVLYVSDPAVVVTQMNLRLAEGSAWNVLIAAPYGSVVLRRVMVENGLNLATPPQIAVDLLSLPGRGSSEAEDVMSWMRRNEAVWRN